MLHVNYARARSLAFVRAALHLLPLSSSERGPARTALSRPSVSLPPHTAILPFLLLISLSSSVRSRANIIWRSGFLRAIKIISINRRLSDTAKTRWPPTGCSSEREAWKYEMLIREKENSWYRVGLQVIRQRMSASGLEFPSYPTAIIVHP